VSRLVALGLLGILMFACGCGGSGSSSSTTLSGGGSSNTANSVTMTVDGGPPGIAPDYVDAGFVSVEVCVPGTTTCQTIDHVLVDTGSSGLRILKSGTASLGLNLAQEGNLVECFQFVTSFTWGPVMLADVKLAGETASSIPVQVIGESNTGFPNIPSACQNSCATPGCSADTLQTLGANGLIGVSPFIQDCGSGCASASTASSIGLYYSCPTSSTCATTAVPLNQQVPNPVSAFTTDNNGVVIQLPSIAASGQSAASGTLIFGIGTQSNNALGSATVFHLDAFGNFTTVYNGQSYPGSFVDSGSNGIFFLDTALTGMSDTNCGGSTGVWYCPASTTNFATTNQGTSGSEAVNFSAVNANTLFSGVNTAFNDLTGPNLSCFQASGPTAPCFDWGLPFFFGRTVFTAIEGQSTPAGSGPYLAY